MGAFSVSKDVSGIVFAFDDIDALAGDVEEVDLRVTALLSWDVYIAELSALDAEEVAPGEGRGDSALTDGADALWSENHMPNSFFNNAHGITCLGKIN